MKYLKKSFNRVEICKIQFMAKRYRSASRDPVVHLPLGSVKGKECIGIYGHRYYGFEGIPFAKPPLGALRFRAPEPAERWDGMLICQKAKPIPLQEEYGTGEVVGSEDCLYLNVYTKHIKSETRRPVMVYIYGGAFRTGGALTSKYGPDYLMREDIVYVLFNYRLGVLGFLSLPDAKFDIPGNAGLKDQLLALKWVKKYISYFCGDPDNVTVFGESAGAASAHFLMCCEPARGLFQKAILMSGCLLNPWAEPPIGGEFMCRLAVENGFSGVSKLNILEFLNKIDPKALIKHKLLSEKDAIAGRLTPFTPIVEPYESTSTLISMPFTNLLKDAWGNSIPLVIGGTSFEGLSIYPFFKSQMHCLKNFKQNVELALPTDVILYNNAASNQAFVNQLVLQHKFTDMLSTLDFYSYKLFWHGIHRAARARLENVSAPTYLYRFDFDSPTFNLARTAFCGNDIKKGVAHADDLAYVFFKSSAWKLPAYSKEYYTIQRMVGILTSFAKTSDPNCAELEGVCWEPLQKSNPFRALNISSEVTFITQPEKASLEVWNRIYRESECDAT